MRSCVLLVSSETVGWLTGESLTQSGAWLVSFRLRLLLAFLFGLPHTYLLTAKEGLTMRQATDQEVIEYLWPHNRRVKKRIVMLRLG